MNNTDVLKRRKAVSCSLFDGEGQEAAVNYIVTLKNKPSEFIFSELNTGFYGRVDYFKALQAGTGISSGFIFPEIYENGELLAAGCFQELRLAAKDFDEPGNLLSGNSKFSRALEKTAKSAMRIGTGKKGLRILIAGNSQVSGPHGLFFSGNYSDVKQSEIWKACLNAVEQEQGPFSVIIVKDIPETLRTIYDSLRTGGFRNVPASPVMVLTIDSQWKTMDDYLNAMSSKYRIRTRAARKKGATLVRQVWDAAKITEHTDEIYKLYNNVYDKARFRLFRINREYFQGLKNAFRNDLLFTAYLIDEKLVGFSTLLMSKTQCDAHLIGLDYAANKEFSLYQNILYDYAEVGINYGAEKIDFGRTAMEIKSTIGAVPEEFSVMIRLKNPLLNGLASLLLENVEKQPWIQRHPFRAE